MVSRNKKKRGRAAKGARKGAAKGSLRPMLKRLKLLLDQVHVKRTESITEKLQRNWRTLESQISMVMSVISTRDLLQTEENTNQMFLSRIVNPLCKFAGFLQGLGKKDNMDPQEILFATNIQIPYIERLPRYTFWVHFTRNQKMPEHESVIGKRQIYYEQHGGETLICSDSEEEMSEPEEHEFTEAEDRILWTALDECGLNEDILGIVRLFVKATDSEIQERYTALKEMKVNPIQHSEDSGGCKSHIGLCLEKSLSDALDSFDNLFCRQCIINDCPLHGFSQPLIYPSEKQPVWSDPEGDRQPCSDQCYLRLKVVSTLSESLAQGSFKDKKNKPMEAVGGILTPSSVKEPGNQSTEVILQEERCNYVTTKPFTTEICLGDLNADGPVSENMRKRKVTNLSESKLRDSILPPDESQSSSKTLKKISDDIVNEIGNDIRVINLEASDKGKHTINCASLVSPVEHTSNKLKVSGCTCLGERDKGVGDGQKDLTNEMPSGSDWKTLEKDLYLKGVEMFGTNSCLIARNLLSGLKTCMEVARYMYAGGVPIPNSIMDRNEMINAERKGKEMPIRSRLLRRKGKARKFKYSRKTAGLPSSWRRIANENSQCTKQYTPCGCHGMCGKQCACLLNGTCCEKYCGCSKLCKNRFRGCHCIKSQCRSRQCPCFAANRECDPDVCRNCWVSCGDGSLGEPTRRGECQCGNMMLLLGQKHRILLARSDVAGWGAFSKNPVKKNDCLGEYTGEVITNKEADKRGKLYDRADFSFLFDLNEQFVLDAYRKGDKLKFANHSSKPNCYAKVMIVAGNHRVGIFAKENIEAGEELFYDYQYDPEHTPRWSAKLKAENSKKDESSASLARAKKHQS